MGDVRDVHDLITLMNVAIGMQHHHTNRRSEIRLSDIVGINVDYNQGNKSTFPILDSLANICISKPKGQVVAIALQLQLKAGRIRLTIAENGFVEDGLVAYLILIWSMLKTLASQFATERARDSKETKLKERIEVSPPVPPDVGRQLRIKIFRNIYCYTQDKNQHRIAKYWDALRAFMRRFYEKHPGELHGFELDLATAFEALDYAFHHYDCKTIQEKDPSYWEHLFSCLEVATYHVNRIAGKESNYWCNRLVAEEDSPTPTRFNLRHALLKITSQHRHYQTLIAFAHSPRLNPAFQCIMSIVTVPPCLPRPVQLPRGASEWKKIINMIVPSSDIGRENSEWREEEAERLWKEFSDSRVHSFSVHCECALIQHLRTRYERGRELVVAGELSDNYKRQKYAASTTSHESLGVRNELVGKSLSNGSPSSSSSTVSQKLESQEYPEECKKVESCKRIGRKFLTSKRTWDEMESQSGPDGWEMVRAFSYIGISKLSCAACNLWIQGFNLQGGAKYYTKGSHCKWYPKWGLPQLNQDVLSKFMVREISATYRQHCRAKGRLKALADGSNAPPAGPAAPHPIDLSHIQSYLRLRGNKG